MFLKVASEEILQFKSEEQWRLTQGRWIRKGEHFVSLPYFLFKLCTALYVLAFYGWSLWYRQTGWYEYSWKYFIYYTHWSYFCFVLWVLTDFVMVASRYRSQSKGGQVRKSREDNPAGHQFLWLVTNLSHALALTVSIAYFAVEFPHSELFNPEKRPEELSGWKVYLEMFCNFNYHLVQAVLVILDTLISSKPKRLLQCWPAFAFTAIYVTFNATYVLSGGTDPEDNPYIYNGLKWNENVLTALITGAGKVLLSVISHAFLWTLALSRDAAWEACYLDSKDTSESTKYVMANVY